MIEKEEASGREILERPYIRNKTSDLLDRTEQQQM